jgi:cell division protein FtsI/penicillin-binding protein 2
MKNTNVLNSCASRTTLVFFAVIIGYVLITVKLFNTQVLQRNYWKALAFEQHFGKYEVPSNRGDILASDGFSLAVTSTTYDLFIDPSIFEGSFSDLSEVFEYVYKDIDFEDEDQKLVYIKTKENIWRDSIDQKEKQFLYLQKGLDHNQKKYIESLSIKGLGFVPVGARSYPDQESFSHLLGFVGQDEDGDSVGYFGLEGFYDGDLRGAKGFVKQERSALGSPILHGGFENIKKQDGSDVKTTIDRAVQTIVYSNLKDAVEDYGAKSGVVIVVNPKTGAVLSMANYPTFNPNEYGNYFKDEPDIFTNSAISSTYEPGSVIKALTMAAAIDKGIVTPETTMVDSGPVYYSTHKVDNWDKKHHGEISMYQVLQLSNNIGASWVGTKVGADELYRYFSNFGLGTKLGIDLQGEEVGEFREPSQWREIDTAAASFGQGLSSTPLQVVMAFAAIANGGKLMEPYVVSEIKNGDQLVVNEPKEIRSVISESSANTMVSMLTKAVSGGEAKYFVSKKYNVAGKTGTAQIAEQGEYLKESTNATFVGFLPNYKEFVMLVKLEKPTSSVYASETAVPLWMEIAEELANYMGLPPDKYE